MTLSERNTFEKALKLWGEVAQVGMLHEEIGELLVVLNKFAREPMEGAHRSALRANTLEEIEDVRIMLDQMLVMLHGGDEHQCMLRAEKINRLDHLINAEKEYRRKHGPHAPPRKEPT